MKRARSSEVFLGGRARARRRLAPLLAAAAYAYLLFVSLKLTGLGSAGPAAAVSRLATAGAGEPLPRRVEEPAPRSRASAAAGGGVSGYGRITGEILRRHKAVGERRRWGQRGNSTELERMAAEAWALGARAWEEASAFTGDVDSIVSRDGGQTKCPGSLALGGGTAAFLPCGLAAGSARVPPPDRARRYKKLAARPARRRLLRRACCFSCGAVLLLILLAVAFAGAVYLIFRPHAPSFSVASLSIRGLDNLSSSPSALSPQLDAAVRADNGANKKVGIDYRGGGDVTVSYSGERLGIGQWPAFYQAPRNVTVFSTELRGQGVSFTDEQRRQLAAEQAASAVPLTVEARVPVRLRFGKVLRTWTVDVKATCEVAVDRLAGNAAAANRGCRVRVKPLWWWW